MTTMDHAAAHERIDDLLLEPTVLAALGTSTAPLDVSLREHLATCAACAADLEGWARLQDHLAGALPASLAAATEAVEPLELPPSLRARIVAAARGADAPPAPVSAAADRRRRGQLVNRWVGLAAAIAVLVGAAGLTVDQASRRAAAEAEAQALAGALAAVDRVLAEPGHRVVELQVPGGSPGGTISWSRHDLVVLSTALPAPAAGKRYRCWLVDGGSSVAIGEMYFAGRTAYWVGSLDEWATFQIAPGTRFVVTVEPVAGHGRSGPVVLEAALGS